MFAERDWCFAFEPVLGLLQGIRISLLKTANYWAFRRVLRLACEFFKRFQIVD